MCFTSPPYAQQRDYKTGAQDWDALMRGVFSILPMKHGAQVLVNLGLVHRDGEWLPYWDGWIEWMRSAGWRRFGWYVWDQGFGLPGEWRGRLAPSHEFIFHFNRIAERARKTVDKKPASIRIGSGGNLRNHIMADRTAGLTDPDDAPAVPEHPVSQTGDLWLLGAKVTCPQCGKITPLERAIKR
jgi:hypothetical protein